MRKIMHSFEVHSNESACRKSGRLGLEQVNNGPVLYVKLKKVLNGLLRSEILLYKELLKELKYYGFKVIPLESCVSKELIFPF